MLLPSKIDPLSEEQGCKKYVFVAPSISHFKIVFVLLAEVVAFYVWAPIV